MKYKVFGKTNNRFAKQVSEETVKKVKEICGDDINVVEFYDMDKPLGKDISITENIFYVPTIICENDGHELGYLENKFALGNDEMIKDMNMCQEWWKQLKEFIEDMIDSEKKRENAAL